MFKIVTSHISSCENSVSTKHHRTDAVQSHDHCKQKADYTYSPGIYKLDYSLNASNILALLFEHGNYKIRM